jgi:hypothetical protein
MVSRKYRFPVAPGLAGAVITLAILTAPALGQDGAKRFYPDDPLLKEPPPLPVKQVAKQDVDELYDFLDNSFATPRREGKAAKSPHSALDVNTLGDVPDSAWYTERHYYHRMSIAELKRGPGNSTPPSAGSWRVISAKSNGVMPGFVIEDAKKNRYVIKFDPPRYPELASAADVVGSKIFYALGYNTPENYVVHFTREQLVISQGVTWNDETGKKRILTDRVIDELLKPQPKSANGAYRAMASRWIPGDVVGPFIYEGERTDDPNDIVPHQDRRELRALRVFASWANHTDAKSINSLDTLVTENGVRYLKHYLIDFGSILGSGGTDAKLPWYGHEYVLDNKGAAEQMFTFGILPPPWQRSGYPKLTGVGRLDYKSFDPVLWKPDYPNPAFLLMNQDDAFWAAKQVASFTDEEIRALVETGEYSDPRAVDWITQCLIQRRDRIAEAWFSKVTPLDKFRVVDGRLTFEDLAAAGESGKQRGFLIRWAGLDAKGHATPLPEDAGPRVPSFRGGAQYLAATIAYADKSQSSPLTVYVRQGKAGLEVVGIDR